MDGITLEKLQVIIEAYTKPYRDELDKVKQKTVQTTSQVERQTSRMSKSYSRVGMAIKGVLAALSITAVVAFGRSCIRLGSDLAEVQNVVDVTFGKMSGAVDAFSKNAITQFGLSELTAKKYMGTYGAMAKSFGIAGEAGYQMSAAITGLTGDVASFYNLSTDAAYTKLKSIFTGETESLKELGVVMTQSALDQYALQNGFGKTTAKMTEQEKVILRYKFVMDQLSDASGDFTRTSKGWANQTRVLALQFESLKATIGQGLINAFTPVIRVINTILAKLQTLASYFKAFTTALFGDAGGSGGSLGDAADSSGQIADNMGSAAESAKKMKEYALGIDELNVINPDEGDGGSGDSGGGGVPDFGNMGGELFGEVTVNPEIEKAVSRMKEALEQLKNAAKPTTESIKKLWNEGLSLLGEFSWTALGDFWDYFLVPLGKWTLGKGLPGFLDTTNKILKDIDWEKLNKSLEDFWKALEPFTENVGEGLLWFYDNVLAPISKWTVNYILVSFLERLTEVLKGLDYYMEKLSPGFEWLGEKIDLLSEKFQNNKLDKGITRINKFLDKLGIKIELPSLEEMFSDHAVENALRSVRAFDLIMTFADDMNLLEGLETWWNEHISPYLDLGKWREKVSVINTSIALAIDDFISYWWKKLSEWWDTDVAPWFTAERWSRLYNDIKVQLKTKWDSTAGEWATGIKSWWSQHVSPWFTAKKWFDLYQTVKTKLKETWDNTVSEWGVNIQSWWDEHVAPWFTIKKWLDIYKSVKESLGTTWTNTVTDWKKSIGDWWKEDVEKWFKLETWTDMMKKVPDAFKETFKGAVNAAVAQLNRLIDWLNEKFNFSYEGLELLGKEIIPAFSVQLFTIPHIPAFANGGFPEDGLFMANHGELVGEFSNGKTAVANNSQIISGIQRGVESANAEQNSLLRESVELLRLLLEKETVIQMDTREVGRSMDSSKRRSGYKLKTT